MGNRTSIEICAGAGGQAIGLEQAGFHHLACVEIDPHACNTLRLNRPDWEVHEGDVKDWHPEDRHAQPDLLAGGVPCPPFSIAGKQLGNDDGRDLFPTMIQLVEELSPRAALVENVRGLLGRRFDAYRQHITDQLEELGYIVEWHLVNASDYGVPQARLRTILVALRPHDYEHFTFPDGYGTPVTVGQALLPTMSANGWEGADEWAELADGFAPALVGGSKKHGGADLGPTRARQVWAKMGVDGLGVADHEPEPGFVGMPKLTVRQTAIIQGFPADWQISGRKTAAYRQVGNAFPAPVARAIGEAIHAAMDAADGITGKTTTKAAKSARKGDKMARSSDTEASRQAVMTHLREKIGIGNTFTMLELREVVPDANQVDRRMRDLRKYGWVIHSRRDDPTLTLSQYRFVKDGGDQDLTGGAPSARLRRIVFERDRHRCVLCGIGAGEPYPDAPGKLAKLTLGHLQAQNHKGSNKDPKNFRTECAECNERSRDRTATPPTIEEIVTEAVNMDTANKRTIVRWIADGQRTYTPAEELWSRISRLPTEYREAVAEALKNFG